MRAFMSFDKAVYIGNTPANKQFIKVFQTRQMKIQNTPFGSNPFKRGVAIITVALFLLTSLSNYAPAAFAQPVNSKVQGGNPSGLFRLDRKSEIRIPPELGLIDESFHGTSGKTILYIQDAHDSLEAQENIAKIINRLVANYGVKTVFEEGYEGPVPTDKYFGFIKDPKIKEKVSWFFMDHLRLGGAEYAHINRTKDFNLVGADSLKLHKENVEQYRLSAEKKEAVTKDLKALEKEFHSLADRRFSKELKEWLKVKEQFDAKKLDLVTYLGRTMPLFGERGAEKSLGLIRFLIEAMRTSDPVVIEKAKHIDAREVFGELVKLEETIRETCVKDATDQKLFDYYKILNLLNRLNDLQVSQEEYEAVKASLKAFDTESFAKFIFSQAPKTLILSRMWERNIKDAIRFYEIAQERDHSISEMLNQYSVGNIKKEELTSTPDVSVLVFGGFHKESIKRILEAKGISYFVVSPRITKLSPRHEQFYKRLMTDGRLSFELPANIRTAVRAESRIVDWNANSDLASAEFRTLLPIAGKISNYKDFSLAAEQAMKAFRSEMRNSEDQAILASRDMQTEILRRIHKARDAERESLGKTPLSLDEKYLPLAKEIIILAREIHSFMRLEEKTRQEALLKELETAVNVDGVSSEEAKLIARLYRSASNMARNEKLSDVIRKKIPLLAAIEYIRDREELYPELSPQIKVFAEGNFNLIQALSNIDKGELSFDYQEVGRFSEFVQGLFKRAADNPQERRLLEGKEAVLKILRHAASFEIPLTSEGLTSARKTILESVNEYDMKRRFGIMRGNIEFYQQSLPSMGVDFQMAHTAGLILYALFKGGKECEDHNFSKVVQEAANYMGIKPKAETSSGTKSGARSSRHAAREESFWEDIFEQAGMGGEWQRHKEREQEYEKERREREEDERKVSEMPHKIKEELERVRRILKEQGFELYETSKQKDEGWQQCGNEGLSELDIQFLARPSYARGHENASFFVKRSMYALKGSDKKNEFVIDIYEVQPTQGYVWSDLGLGYSIKISINDGSKKSWYEYADSGNDVFSLKFGDQFSYDKDEGVLTLTSGNLRVSIDRKKQLKVASLKSGDIECLRDYPYERHVASGEGGGRMSVELYNMLKQYAGTSQITIYGSQSYPFQFALIDDPYNARSLIVNHKGAVIYSSSEEGDIERSSLVVHRGKFVFERAEGIQLRGKRKNGTTFVLNRYGFEEGQSAPGKTKSTDEWSPRLTGMLVEAYQLSMDRRWDDDERSMVARMKQALKTRYRQLSEADIEKVVARCLELKREIAECGQTLEAIFETDKREGMQSGKYFYMIGSRKNYSWDKELEYSLFYQTVRDDWWGSPDDSQQTLTEFELYLTEQGQLKIKFKDVFDRLVLYTRSKRKIDEAQLQGFYTKYSVAALVPRKPGGNPRSEMRDVPQNKAPQGLPAAQSSVGRKKRSEALTILGSEKQRSFMDSTLPENVFFAIDAKTLENLGEGMGARSEARNKLWDELRILTKFNKLKIFVPGDVTGKAADRVRELSALGGRVLTAIQVPGNANVIYFTEDDEANLLALPEKLRSRIKAVFSRLQAADFIAAVRLASSSLLEEVSSKTRNIRQVIADRLGFDPVGDLKMLLDAFVVISRAA